MTIDKRFATLRAEAAVAGYDLRTDPLGGYYATRWGYVRLFDGLDDAEAWLRRVSGKPAVCTSYEAGKSAYLARNPHASADDIEQNAKRIARREGL